jgi:hypothetical protein
MKTDECRDEGHTPHTYGQPCNHVKNWCIDMSIQPFGMSFRELARSKVENHRCLTLWTAQCVDDINGQSREPVRRTYDQQSEQSKNTATRNIGFEKAGYGQDIDRSTSSSLCLTDPSFQSQSHDPVH